MKKLFGFAVALLFSFTLTAQKNKEQKPVKVDSVPPPITIPKRIVSGPKKFEELITDKAVAKTGMFNVYKVEDKWYFEIPDSMLNRQIMAITRYSKVAGGGNVYGGELANQQTLIWEKGPNNNLFLRVVATITSADSANQIFQSVSNSNINPIVAAFDIKAYGKDSAGSIIDVTDFLTGDNQVVNIDPMGKRSLNLLNINSDRSYIKYINSYPINIEVRTVKTYNSSPSPFGNTPFMSSSLPASFSAGVATFEMNVSFILLPSVPMQKRDFDPRVGYFADDYSVFSDNQQKVQDDMFILRWRLEPKPKDMDKWKRGELVEPQKPIVYYIDPATPKKWRPYIMQGINDWQAAFEKAGFKNAIMAKEWPENDSTMSLEDARFSVVRYFASGIQNANGPNVHDPRTGEILESHIQWYHNVMKLLHDWYFIQAGAVDAKARKMIFDDSLMGKLIRFSSSHEIGHTLGLRHNMGSSSTVPVEMLRNKKWVEAHGHTPSIMDYARFNYVAQPEDSISEAGLLPRIGDYDKWAIQWGYAYSGAKNEEEDKQITGKWILDSLSADPHLFFGSEMNPYDPRSQNEDLGDNAMKAGDYGIKNLKRILPQLISWTYEPDDKYDNLDDMYTQLTNQFGRYMGHVLRYVGGVYETPKSVEQAGDVYTFAPKDLQKDAVAFLNKQLFETPQWLLNDNILNKISSPVSAGKISTIQSGILNSLIGAARLNRLTMETERFGEAKTYAPDEMLTDVKNGVWSELKTKKPIDNLRRNLQKAYVETLTGIINPSPSSSSVSGLPSGLVLMFGNNVKNTDVPSIVRAHLIDLRSEILAAIPATKDKLSRYHLQDVAERIKTALNPK